MADDFELPGPEIYKTDFGRVHLGNAPGEHEAVINGHYVNLPRGTLGGIGRGDINCVQYATKQLDGVDCDPSEFEKFLLRAQVAELTTEVRVAWSQVSNR